jgi:hypothetical protein
MALGDPYATRTELKSYVGIADTTDDAKVDDALAAASRGIDHHCRRQFNKTTTAVARVFHPFSAWLATVDDFHTTTDLAIKTDSGDDGTYETTLTSTEYTLEPANGIIDGESGWPYYRILATTMTFPCASVRPSVQVTAQWGWNAVPGPVKQACLLLASEALKLAREAPFGVAGFGAFGAVRVRDNPRAESMLAPYRINPVLVG